MVCPICEKGMKKSKYGYICENFSRGGNGCDFSVNTEICKNKISAAQVATLLKDGRIDVIKGIKSKAGKEFDAALVLNLDDKDIQMINEKAWVLSVHIPYSRLSTQSPAVVVTFI